MAVYTKLTNDEIRKFLTQFDIAALVSAKPIAEGIENTNYLIVAGKKRYILTLFENRVSEKDLPFFLGLTQWLSERRIPCPRPILTKGDKMFSTLKGKPAALVEFLEGKGSPNITPYHMRQLGSLAAHMHLAAMDFPKKRSNDLSLPGFKKLFAGIEKKCDKISPGMAKIIKQEIAYLEKHWPEDLPSGVIHADLFPDNVFFKRDDLSGVIDFYFACNDFWIYDLMICMNAWCFNGAQKFLPSRAKTLLQAYHSIRPITRKERDAIPVLARAAALRFLLTRSHDWLNRVPGALVTPKDPLEYLAKLTYLQGNHPLSAV